MSAKKDQPLRWTLNQAAAEFGWARQTVKNRMVHAGISPGKDDTYTTKQIVAALFGDRDTADMRKATAEADVAEMERDEKAAKLLPASAVEAVWQDALGQMKDVIMANPMPDDTRRAVLKSLQVIPLSEYVEAKARADAGDPTSES